MSDTRELLANRANQIEAFIAKQLKARQDAADYIADIDKKVQQAREDLAEARSLLAVLDGTFEAAPRDVQSDEDVLGLRIAGLSLDPGAEPTVDDLRLWAAVMRELYEQATHQARLAVAAIAERERRTEQVDVPTTEFQAVQPVDEIPWVEMVGKAVRIWHIDGHAADGLLEDVGEAAAVLRDVDDVPIGYALSKIRAIRPLPEVARPDAEAEQPQDGAS